MVAAATSTSTTIKVTDTDGRTRNDSSSASSSQSLLCSSRSDMSYVGLQSGALLEIQHSMEVSTSVVLNFCRKNVLRHYFRLLTFVGWRPLLDTEDRDAYYLTLKLINVTYFFVVIAIMALGHLLQYAACFRRDSVPSFRDKETLLTKGWVQETVKGCTGSLFAVYVLPGIMHIIAYVITLTHTRSEENEHFQALMEKVFLQMTLTDVWHVSKKRITQRLRAVYAAGVVWVFASIGSQILNIYAKGTISFHWMVVSEKDSQLQIVLLITLILTVLFQDIVSMMVATTYAIHCQLVLVYLQHMSQAIREKRMTFLEFYRSVEEARKSVKYLNQKQGLGVTVQMSWLCTRCAVCIYALLATPWSQLVRFCSAWLNVLLWFSLALIPLVQACRLSSECSHVREVGLELTARPFGYMDVPQSDLDTFLLFTSSLRMQAKLCALPVTKGTVTFVLLLVALSLFVAVQLDIIRFGP